MLRPAEQGIVAAGIERCGALELICGALVGARSVIHNAQTVVGNGQIVRQIHGTFAGVSGQGYQFRECVC